MTLLTLTPTTFKAGQKDARPGDTLSLEGDFSAMIVGLSDLTDVGLDLSGAIMGSLQLLRVSGAMNAAKDWPVLPTYKGGLGLTDCHDFTASDVAMRGVAGTPNIVVSGGSHVTLRGAQIAGGKIGVTVSLSPFFQSLGHHISGCGNDGLILTGSPDCKLLYGQWVRSGHLPGVHTDAVQAYSKAGMPPCDRLEIGHCYVDQTTQGFGDWGNMVDAVGWSIHDNRLRLDHGNGISMGRSLGEVRDNDVSTLPGSPNRASINISAGVIRSGNIVAAAVGKSAVIDPPPPDAAALARQAEEALGLLAAERDKRAAAESILAKVRADVQ